MLSEAELVRLRKDAERLFNCRCSVYEKEEYKNEAGITRHREVLVLEDIPCRVSYSTGMLFNKLNSGKRDKDAVKNPLYVKIFTAHDILIKPGSKIAVTNEKGEHTFYHSGERAEYLSHNEVLVENFKEWS